MLEAFPDMKSSKVTLAAYECSGGRGCAEHLHLRPVLEMQHKDLQIPFERPSQLPMFDLRHGCVNID
jgi:hypothetical protein